MVTITDRQKQTEKKLLPKTKFIAAYTLKKIFQTVCNLFFIKYFTQSELKGGTASISGNWIG